MDSTGKATIANVSKTYNAYRDWGEGIPDMAGVAVRWDSCCAGLGLRKNKKGPGSFLCKLQYRGRQLMFTLGRTDELTVSEARALTKRAKALARKGIDPRPVKVEKDMDGTGKKPVMISFGDFCDRYIEEYARRSKRTWQEDQKRINGYLRDWFERPLHLISQDDVRKLHRTIGERAPYQANRIIEQLGKMFRLAIEWELVPNGWKLPIKGIVPFKEISRDRFLDESEMGRLLEAIRKCRHEGTRAALLLYILTGLRRQELGGLKWSEVDLDKGFLHLPGRKTKNGRAHTLPLSEPAIAILKALPRSGELVLADGGRGASVRSIKKAWEIVKVRSQLENVRLHDLRRTLGSWLAQAGFSPFLIGEILNHSSVYATSIYARFGTGHAKAALESHGAKLEQVCGLSASVVSP